MRNLERMQMFPEMEAFDQFWKWFYKKVLSTHLPSVYEKCREGTNFTVPMEKKWNARCMPKSGKQKTVESYFENGDDVCKYGSDDDFESDFTPPSKKAKSKNQDHKNERESPRNEKSSPKERPSLEDKLYERNVEKALQLSLASQELSQERKKKTDKENHKPEQIQVDEEDSDYVPEQEKACVSEEEDYDESEDENDSDFNGEESKKQPVSVRKRKKINRKQPSQKSKVQPAITKKVDTIKSPAKTKAVDKPKTMAKITSRLPETYRPIVSSEKTPSSTRGSVGTISSIRSLGLGGVVIKNPGPPIRVGLSRNRKVKPLHSRVSVAH